MNQALDKKFARAYVAQNSGHDFSELRDIAEEIVFITTGYEDEGTLLTSVVAGLHAFSPTRDIIVPVGNVYINMLTGIVATELSKEWGYYKVAIYREKEYHIQHVALNTVGDLINVYRRNINS